MADIETPKWRDKTKIGALMHRVRSHAEGTIEMTSTQLKAAELFLRKTVPDLNRTELTGKNGGPVKTQEVTESDQEILRRYKEDK